MCADQRLKMVEESVVGEPIAERPLAVGPQPQLLQLAAALAVAPGERLGSGCFAALHCRQCLRDAAQGFSCGSDMICTYDQTFYVSN